MSDFTDDDEYESFELSSRKGARGGEQAEDLDDVDDLDEEEDEAEDDDLDEDDDDEDYEDIEDALDDEIDLVIAAYREDGEPVATALNKDLANDLDELIAQLRRLPADAGSIGFVSLVEEVFVIVRVRGRNVQALLSDAAAAADWPIARDVADFLGVEEIPDPDDDSVPMGDLGIVSDLGVSEFAMEAFCENLDDTSDELLTQIADKIKFGSVFRKAFDSFD